MPSSKVQEIGPSPKPLTAAEKAAKIDRYGELDRQLELMAPIEEEHAALKAEFQSWHEHDQADKPVIEAGQIYQVQMSPRTNKRTILNKKKVFEMMRRALGIDALIGIVDIPLSEIDKTIPESMQKGLLHKERSGYRTVKVVPLLPAKAA
jgi:hypothetical protein